MHKRRFLTGLVSSGLLAQAPAWALYDPPPVGGLAAAPGGWRGTLSYRDYRNPERTVVLPTRLSVALTAPDELALYYVFDDGPGKTVHSYERMGFDFAKGELQWVSGAAKPERRTYRLSAPSAIGDAWSLGFERSTESGTDRYRWELSPRSWTLAKTELRNGADDLPRNRYQLARGEP